MAAAVSPDTAQNPEPHKPQSLYQKKRHTSDIVLRIVIYTATAITVAAFDWNYRLYFMEWYSAYHMVIPFFTVFGNKGKYEGYSAHDYQYLIYCSHYLVDIGSDWYFRGNLFDAICKARKTCSRNSFYHRSSFPAFHLSYLVCSVIRYSVFCSDCKHLSLPVA